MEVFAMAEIQNFPASVHNVLADHAYVIRTLGKQTIENLVAIGCRLNKCKELVGHGNWLPWLEREFGWADKTAENFINVYKLSGKFENFSNLDLPLSGLYRLAAPSTPEAARTEIVERAQAGEQISVAEVESVIDTAKNRQPARKPGTHTEPVDAQIAALKIVAETGRTLRQRAVAAERIRGLMGRPQPRDDIGPASRGEIERLRTRNEELERENRRLEGENIALRSEIREMKARLGTMALPPDDGLSILGFRRQEPTPSSPTA
jgi:hypothetical protein